MQILYKKTTTGAVQQWSQEIQGDRYRTITGQVNGQLTTSEWHICTPKNQGRVNATTAEQQCQKEVAANYQKKLTAGGYTTDIEEIGVVSYFKPMLAKKYKDYAHKIKYLVFVQPKYDGIRCVINRQGAWSRKGEPIITVPHILQSLEPVFAEYPNLVLDGELYSHSLKDDFNKICSVVKKLKPTLEDIQTAQNNILFYVYDCSLQAEYTGRLNFLMNNLKDYKYLIISETLPVNNREKVDAYLDQYLQEGYEGVIVRTDSYYENKRSNNLLKYKVDDTDEFVLLDITEGQGNWAGLAKKALLVTAGGVEFEASIANTQDVCREFLVNKDLYIGQPTTVKYNGLTPAGKPRFGVVKEFNRRY